jgi:choline dehydrogenase-like flavoprotein
MAQFSPATEVDFVVIGSGAGGGIMAKQLSTAGFTVVVLEQGGWGKYGKEHEYTKDEYLNDSEGMEYQLMSDRLASRIRSGAPTRRLPRQARTATAAWSAAARSPTAAAAGGTCRGSSMRPRTQGGVPGTGLQDWPITYEELEPYYVQAEWEMGISGMRVDSPFLAPMSKDYPGAPGAAEGLRRAHEMGASKMGLTGRRGPLAVISQNYQAGQPA